jgi:hypothetical protein
LTGQAPSLRQSGFLLAISGQKYLENYKGEKMNRNKITFEDAELAALNFRTAKNGNAYASGILILRDEKGKFEASLPFRSFDAVASLKALESTATNPELSGGDLHFDGEDADTRERKPAKTSAKHRVNVSGWLRTNKVGDKWITNYMLESLSI